MRPDGTMLVASSRDHSLMAAWSAGDTDTASPQVFLLGWGEILPPAP